jgi:hypothetical protein
MAFTEYTKDTTIIGALGTNPAERALTTQEFKDKFDQFADEFVAWFNETHLPEVAEKAVVDEHLAEYATDSHVIANITGLQSVLETTVTKAYKRFVVPAGTIGWIRIAQHTNSNQIFGGDLSIATLSGSGNNGGSGEFSILSNQTTKKIVLKNSLKLSNGVFKLRLIDPNASWVEGNYIDLYVNVHSTASIDIYCRWIESAFIPSAAQALTFLNTYILNPTVPEGYRTTEIELI